MNTKIFSIIMLIFAVAIFTGCEDDVCEELMVECGENGSCNDGICECDEGWTGTACDKVVTAETLTGELNADKTLEGDRVYEISGKYVVNEGATLKIKPGAILKFAQGQETAASALIIARGGKIDADGTTNKPIIMTSVLDNIEPGQITGTNLGKSDIGLWGGLIILGKAKVSAKEGNIEGRIEGIPESEGYGLYGGDDDEDDSGVLNYVSVRHAGVLIGEDNEINGITLGGVGNKTKIENVEVVANFDDGIECFGGSVNIKNALIVYQGDDAIDLDQNYSGTIDNFYIKHGNSKTDEAFEIDGPENETYTDGKFTLVNGTVRNDGSDGTIADLKSSAQGTIDNVSFMGYPNLNYVKVRASYDTATADSTDVCAAKKDGYAHIIDGDLVIKNCEVVSAEETTLSNFANGYADEDDSPCRYTGDDEAALDKVISEAGNSIVGTPTKGADLDPFKDWSWASANGEL